MVAGVARSPKPTTYIRNKHTGVTFEVELEFARYKLTREPGLYQEVDGYDGDSRPIDAMTPPLPDPEERPYATWLRWQLVQQGINIGLFDPDEVIEHSQWPQHRLVAALERIQAGEAPEAFRSLQDVAQAAAPPPLAPTPPRAQGDGLTLSEAMQEAFEAMQHPAPGEGVSPAFGDDYDEWTVAQLLGLAQQLELDVPTRVRKAELVEQIRAYYHAHPEEA